MWPGNADQPLRCQLNYSQCSTVPSLCVGVIIIAVGWIHHEAEVSLEDVSYYAHMIFSYICTHLCSVDAMDLSFRVRPISRFPAKLSSGPLQLPLQREDTERPFSEEVAHLQATRKHAFPNLWSLCHSGLVLPVSGCRAGPRPKVRFQ